MTLKSSFLFLAVSFLLLTTSHPQGFAASEGQEFLPFVAEITIDHVNVRAGQSASFERLVKLSARDEVVVVEHSFSWYKIELPKTAKTYIVAKYVQLLNDAIGGVTTDRVNVRAGPDINYSVIGQVNSGEEIHILEHIEDKWYKIVPTKNTYGWIKEDFLNFKSNDVQSFYSAQSKSEKLETVDLVKEDDQELHLVGYIKSEHNILLEDIQYNFEMEGKTSYYLIGFEEVFSEFLDYKVSIDGQISEDQTRQYSLPILKVTKIEMVL